MKRMILLVVVVVLTGAFLFAGGQGEEEPEAEPINLRWGSVNPMSHPFGQGAQYMADLLEERTDGRITISFFPSSQLGGVSEMLQQVQVGALDITFSKPGTLSDMGYEEINLYELPYVFRDEDHLNNVMFSDLGQDLLDGVQENGLRMVSLAYFSDGARSMFFTDKEVTTLDDMQGLRVRVQPIAVFEDLMDAFGASATPIAYAELFSALQTGVVDAAENPVTGYYENNFYEVAPYYTFNQHTMAPTFVHMSELTWNELSNEDQELIREAAVESGEYVLEIVAEQRDEMIAEMEQEHGVTFFELEDQEAWLEAAAPVVEKYGADYMDLIERVQAVQ